MNRTNSLIYAAFATMALAACSPQKSVEQLSAKEEIRMSALDVNLYPSSKVVCDPMGGDPDPRSNVGLAAELYWMDTAQARPNNVTELISTGHKSDRKLFFSQLYTPTRLFDLGFNNDLGEPVKDDTGNTLIEWFGLRFKSVVKLAPDQPEGLYEFAILSDDGAILRMRDEDGVYRTMVDNDGVHPTRLGCGSPLVHMGRDTEKLIELDYYQGPRMHISMILLMRKVTPNADGTFARDSACGMTSNEAWFNPDAGSVEQPAYLSLLSRGWQPLKKENYMIPVESVFNPCKEGDVPVISNFKVDKVLIDGFTVSWQTDIPATSQLSIKQVSTGKSRLTNSDNILRTSHSITYRGLPSATLFELQALSISETYGKGLSQVIRASTPEF
ncbi:MAG TPA: hypothetical protein VM432_06005 [Bdellovibrionales bacterium]|nr:hypothetical protein [Bdellovibrionales bacterium]